MLWARTAVVSSSWGHEGHGEQRAAAIIGAMIGYASMKNALKSCSQIQIERHKTTNKAVY